MTARTLDRWIGRALHMWCGGLFLLLFGTVCYGTGLMLRADGDWPYDVIGRQIVSDHVPPGDEIGMRRLIDYHQEDCWRQYDRKVISKVETGERPGMTYKFPTVPDQRLPVMLSGIWQTWTEKIPDDFTCGPAILVETVTAACTFWQRHFRPLRKPDVITPFTVSCPSGP